MSFTTKSLVILLIAASLFACRGEEKSAQKKGEQRTVPSAAPSTETAPPAAAPAAQAPEQRIQAVEEQLSKVNQQLAALPATLSKTEPEFAAALEESRKADQERRDRIDRRLMQAPEGKAIVEEYRGLQKDFDRLSEELRTAPSATQAKNTKAREAYEAKAAELKAISDKERAELAGLRQQLVELERKLNPVELRALYKTEAEEGAKVQAQLDEQLSKSPEGAAALSKRNNAVQELDRAAAEDNQRRTDEQKPLQEQVKAKSERLSQLIQEQSAKDKTFAELAAQPAKIAEEQRKQIEKFLSAKDKEAKKLVASISESEQKLAQLKEQAGKPGAKQAKPDEFRKQTQELGQKLSTLRAELSKIETTAAGEPEYQALNKTASEKQLQARTAVEQALAPANEEAARLIKERNEVNAKITALRGPSQAEPKLAELRKKVNQANAEVNELLRQQAVGNPEIARLLSQTGPQSKRAKIDALIVKQLPEAKKTVTRAQKLEEHAAQIRDQQQDNQRAYAEAQQAAAKAAADDRARIKEKQNELRAKLQAVSQKRNELQRKLSTDPEVQAAEKSAAEQQQKLQELLKKKPEAAALFEQRDKLLQELQSLRSTQKPPAAPAKAEGPSA